MPYFDKCPYCGANNDPGEKCTCQEEIESDVVPDKIEIITLKGKGKHKDLKIEAQTYKLKF